MTYTFSKYVREAEKPYETLTSDNLDELVQKAEEWVDGLDPSSVYRLQAFISNESEVLWTFPKDLLQTTFDSEISSYGNSLNIAVSRQARIMGLKRGDVVNVTLRRINNKETR